MIIATSNLSKNFGKVSILKDVTFKVEDNEKVGIVGVNGAGKTTLMKVLAEEYEKDGGEIFKAKDLSIGYLSQNSEIDTDQSIFEVLEEVFTHLINMENKLRSLEQSMANLKNDELQKVMNTYSNLQHEFQEQNGYGYKAKIRGIAKGLGFSDKELEQSISTLSGGQKTRVSLAKLLLIEPSLLLLDEPTNHLDIKAIEWLEGYIKSYKYAVIIICHDRYFLDNTVTKIVEIQHGKSKEYAGNYSFYATHKAIDRQIELKHYILQQKDIRRQEDMIRMYYNRATEKMIRIAKSKQKLLDKVERLERPEALPQEIRMMFDINKQSGFEALQVNNLAMSFDTKDLFSNLTFDVKRNDFVAVLGDNGIGKTTLFKILLNQLEPKQGTFRFGTNVSLGYYDQEQQSININKTIFQEIQDTYPAMSNQEVRNVLATFQFKNEDVFKKISVLSGGERARVVLAKLLLQKSNFLLLDEPTNHLDISSKEVLEEALMDYEGTVLFISHDRYFINRLATRVMNIKKNGVDIFDGSYEEYKEKINAIDIDTKTIDNSDYLQRKLESSAKRKKENEIKRIEEQIDSLEQDIINLKSQLQLDEVINDYIKYNDINLKIGETEQQLANLLDEWETMH